MPFPQLLAVVVEVTKAVTVERVALVVAVVAVVPRRAAPAHPVKEPMEATPRASLPVVVAVVVEPA